MSTSIFQTLEKLGLSSMKTRILFNGRTRDVEDLKVWKDKVSGVIYIDDFFVGDSLYRDTQDKKVDLERGKDVDRRVKKYLKYVINKKIADFGCGSGDFLREVALRCESACGIELSKGYRNLLLKEHINCVENLNDIEDKSLDIVVSFHCLEHLPNPLEVLNKISKKIISGGSILIEVPHANDFLLSKLFCEDFKQFTLWSQHLILHTRDSLNKTLEFAGFKEIHVEGVQRYPLSNHLNWLASGTPGGHTSPLSPMDSDELFDAYEKSLAGIDATDTLVAFAKVP